MPVYEYQCEKCKDVVEVLQKVSDDPVEVCEKCGGKLSKQFNSNELSFVRVRFLLN